MSITLRKKISGSNIVKSWKVIFVFFLFLLFTCSKHQNLEKVKFNSKLRVISGAPSITETIFALGAESTLVGVSDYCQYPPQAKSLPKIGGYFNPAYETILLLKPNLAFVIKEHKKLIEFLQQNNIKTVTISTHTLEDICSSFVIIGRELNKKEKADSINLEIKKEINNLESLNLLPKPTILFCVGRDKIGNGTIGTVYSAGVKTFYSQLIEIAGGKNCINDPLFEYPLLSAEKILKLSPDIIIDITGNTIFEVDTAKIKQDWLELSSVPAIKNNTLYVLKGDYLSIPGPRIVKILKEIKRIIEDWKAKCSSSTDTLSL